MEILLESVNVYDTGLKRKSIEKSMWFNSTSNLLSGDYSIKIGITDLYLEKKYICKHEDILCEVRSTEVVGIHIIYGNIITCIKGV